MSNRSTPRMRSVASVHSKDTKNSSTRPLRSAARHRQATPITLDSACVCPSLYASQLERYLRHFAQERILVVDQADLLTDRGSALEQVFDFLGVESTLGTVQLTAEFLKSSERRSYPPAVANLVGFTIAPRLQRLPPEMRRALRRSVEWAFPPLEPFSLDDATRSRLEEIYSGEVERLRALTGKAFSSWSV